MQAFSFILFISHTTRSCPESTDQTPAVVALGAVLVIVVLLAVAILTIVLLYTSESVMSEYVHCMCTYVRACVYIRTCECVPEGNVTI